MVRQFFVPSACLLVRGASFMAMLESRTHLLPVLSSLFCVCPDVRSGGKRRTGERQNGVAVTAANLIGWREKMA